MTPTVEFDYKKYLGLIAKKRYLFVVLALVITTGITAYSYWLPKIYEASCSVFIEKSVISDLVKGIAITPSMDDKIRVLAYAMKSRTLLMKVFNDLGMNVSQLNDAQLEKTIKSFQGRTDIRLKDREGMFIITFSDLNPRIARDFVNTLVRRYIEDNVSSKREESYGATRFLGEQITTVREKFEAAEAKVNDFKRNNSNLLAVSEGMIQGEISEAQRRLEEISLRRNEIEGVRNMLKKNDPLQAKLAGLQKRMRELSVVYTDSYPEVLEVKHEIEAIKAQMKSSPFSSELAAVDSQELQRMTLELRSLQEIERNQNRIIASKRTLLKSIPVARSSLDELEREKNTQKGLYEQLMTRHGQSEVSKQMEVQDKTTTFRIVDPAVMPIKPSAPKRVKIIFMGILAGLVGSFGLLVAIDFLDNSVKDLDVLKSVGVAVLAVIPKIENPDEQKRIRRKDLWFFTAAGVYSCAFLVLMSLEYVRENSLEVPKSAEIEQHITRVMGQFIK